LLGYVLIYTQVVKGRPTAPHVQGFIERGNAPFQQALQDWMQVNNTDSWHVGAFIANQQMNNRPHEGRDNADSISNLLQSRG
jgi:hypothetical protein